MKISSLHLFFICCLLPFAVACQPKATNTGIKLSQFERVIASDLYIDKNNVYHVVFQESPDFGKPIFVYYTTSKNAGQTWSKPVTLSNDGSGNGSGYARILEDKQGNIYAIWKRYGKTQASYPVAEVTLDGRGGYVEGTIFYKVLRGGAWSAQMQVSAAERSQYSWFPALHPNGSLAIIWSEVSPESLANNWLMWYYADWIQQAVLTPGGPVGRLTISAPSAPAYKGGAPEQKGVQNLDGYIDAKGIAHMIFERIDKKQRTLWYFDGKGYTVAYTYPMYKDGNTFQNPPRLLVDDKGNDHIILRPASAVLESEQIWDIVPALKQQHVIADITKKGVTINNIQAAQGPAGKMAVCFQVGGLVSSSEAIGCFYENGKWTYSGITKNAAKEQFFFKDLSNTFHRAYLATLTRYSTTHTGMAYDKNNKPQMTMTLSSDMMAGGYRVNSPSLIFVK